MIDEKKIEEAAKNFCESLEDERKAIQQAELDKGAKTAYTFIRPEVAFEAGINWFKGNLWHHASEEPEEGKRLLVENTFTGEKSYDEGTKKSLYNSWQTKVNREKITRWLYIEDLMKGGK